MIPARRHLPVLLILFLGSGCAALIYEIVWFQLLQLVIGSTAVSLGTILATFMGGMCLGSLLFSRPSRVGRHPLRTYGGLELGIGLCGIAVFSSVPALGKFYTDYVGYGPTASFLRAAICALCLLPPTLLLGATLPVISRSLKTGRSSMAWMGLFYGSNIVGGVCGCLLAGFYLLRVHNMAIATGVAVSINFGVGLAALILARFTPPQIVPDDAEVPELPDAGLNAARVHLTIALSGVAALGAEVVWSRQLSLVFGGTVYTFSIVLAIFLLGLGGGSIAGSWVARSVQRPLLALGLCQILACLAIAWTSWAIAYSLPYWPADVSDQFNPWRTFGVDLLRCFWAVLPATCLWGASFPLALAQVGAARGDPGHAVGKLYAANTAGAIVGALVFSLVMIPAAGSKTAQQVLIGISALSAALALGSGSNSNRKWRISILVLGTSAVLAWSVPALPGLAVAYGRSLTRWVSNPPDILYVGEGINSSVAVTEWPNGVRNFHVAGKVEASTEPKDMRLQRMLGHLSALAHPEPKSILIVGFGAGVTAGAFVLYPEVERIVICEIEPLIPQVVSTYFGAENYYVLNDPRVQVIYDDARHFLMTTREQFDVITSDPIHPWIKGAAALYTREYFENVRRHLKPGGVVSQWVPLYDSSGDVVKSEFATFFKSFPNGTVWSNDIKGRGYDTVLIGWNGPAGMDLDAWSERLGRRNYQLVMNSLHEVGFTSVLSLLSTFAGRATELTSWLEDAQINTDRDLRLQYLAGFSMNSDIPDEIYQEFLQYRTFPEDLFTGSVELREGLRRAFLPPLK